MVAIVDADGTALSMDEEAEISTSGEASVQLSNTPAGGAAASTTLWQANLIGIRATWYVSWGVRKAVPAVYLTF